jgi:hypothetical protein
MYKFMSKAGIVAYNMDAKQGHDNAARRLGAANQCSAGMARAEPINVWGRLKRQTIVGKEGRLLLFVVIVDGTVDDPPLILALLILVLLSGVVEVEAAATPPMAGTSAAAVMKSGPTAPRALRFDTGSRVLVWNNDAVVAGLFDDADGESF